jgi:hypothetical protein
MGGWMVSYDDTVRVLRPGILRIHWCSAELSHAIECGVAARGKPCAGIGRRGGRNKSLFHAWRIGTWNTNGGALVKNFYFGDGDVRRRRLVADGQYGVRSECASEVHVMPDLWGSSKQRDSVHSTVLQSYGYLVPGTQ